MAGFVMFQQKKYNLTFKSLNNDEHYWHTL